MTEPANRTPLPAGDAGVLFGMSDLKPHGCRLGAITRHWQRVLGGGYGFTPDAHLAAECTVDPDRLPGGWTTPWADGRDYSAPGDPLMRLRRDLIRVADVAYDAFTTAGFSLSEAGQIVGGYDLLTNLHEAAAIAWEYRRYGFTVQEMHSWHDACGSPAVARIYADLGWKPDAAGRLRAWLTIDPPVDGQTWALVEGAILCYRISRTRALGYVDAGLDHEEIHYWATARRRADSAGKAEHDETVQIMAALNANRC